MPTYEITFTDGSPDSEVTAEHFIVNDPATGSLTFYIATGDENKPHQAFVNHVRSAIPQNDG